MSNWVKGLFNNDNVGKNGQEVPKCQIDERMFGLKEPELLLISSLVDNGTHEFLFQPETPDYYDPAFKTLREEISEKKIAEVIESLREKEYLIKENLPSAVQCPNCYSTNLTVRYSCPRCETGEVVKNEIIEHPYCGYRDKKSSFLALGDFVCPKCNSVLTRRENSEKNKNKKYVIINTYRINGSIFQCKKCNEIINKPDIYFVCNDCGTKYNYRNAIYQKSIKYIIPDNIFDKISNRNMINLLIVEDKEIEADIMSLLFSENKDCLDYKITIANLGKDALETIKNIEYDIVIQDLGLPDIEGLKLLQEIKKIKPNLNVIVYTGYDDRETAVEAMKLGAVEFLIKDDQNIKSLPEIVKHTILAENHMAKI